MGLNKDIIVKGKIKSKPEDYRPGSAQKVYWKCKNGCDKCKKDHIWETAIKKRVLENTQCPYCSPNNIKPHCYYKSLAYFRRDLSEDWDIFNNEKTPGDYLPNSNEVVWWICYKKFNCNCTHSWRDSINHRNCGCPYCSHRKICMHQSLEYLRPDLMKEWDYEKNFEVGINPAKIALKSTIRAYWICQQNKNHRWIAAIQNRTDKNVGCPRCKNKTETKLLDWFNTFYPDEVTHQSKYNWCKSLKFDNIFLPFDFSIENFKIIIELDGEQISNWPSPEENQKVDKANENGYTVIRILQDDVFFNKIDWESELIKAIKRYDIPTRIYICNGDKYDCYNTIN